MRWRAFYADGSAPHSAETTWPELPARGLVAVVWWDATGQRHLESGADAVVWVAEGPRAGIVAVNVPTPEFEAAAAACGPWLKYGELLAPETWAAIRAQAEEARTPPEG